MAKNEVAKYTHQLYHVKKGTGCMGLPCLQVPQTVDLRACQESCLHAALELKFLILVVWQAFEF